MGPFSTTTVPRLAIEVLYNFASIIMGPISVLLGIVASLLALAWAIRKFSRHVSGGADWEKAISEDHKRNVILAGEIENSRLLSFGENTQTMDTLSKL